MSIVADLREALQDVVAPDLKAVVRGLADLTQEVRSSNAMLREDMQSSILLLREEMRSSNALFREEMQRMNASLRGEIEASEKRTGERVDQSEKRTGERIERVYDAIKLADLTRRYEEVLRENQQLKISQTEQQH